MWPLIFCQHTIHQVIWPSPGTLAAVRNQVKRCQLPVAVRASFVFSSISVQSHFHPKNLIEMWITCLDQVSADSKKVRGSGWAVTPSTQSNLFPKLICFFYIETHKVSTSLRGGFHMLLHKTFLELVHSARLSCTADTRPRFCMRLLVLLVIRTNRIPTQMSVCAY